MPRTLVACRPILSEPLTPPERVTGDATSGAVPSTHIFRRLI